MNMTPIFHKLKMRTNSCVNGEIKTPLIDIYDNKLNKHMLYLEKRNQYTIKSTREFFIKYKTKL